MRGLGASNVLGLEFVGAKSMLIAGGAIWDKSGPLDWRVGKASTDAGMSGYAEDAPYPWLMGARPKLGCWVISGICCGTMRGLMAGLWDGLRPWWPGLLSEILKLFIPITDSYMPLSVGRWLGEWPPTSPSKVSELTRFGDGATEDTSEYSEGVRRWPWN